MTGKLPPQASVVTRAGISKLHAPAAARNMTAICDLLRTHAPGSGQALEIASGTGQHVVAFAKTLPGLHWHPTEIAAEKRASIDAYVMECGLANISAASALDAAKPDWHQSYPAYDLVITINLLHLISTAAAETVLFEVAKALAPDGKLVLYGPFKRNGELTSQGDVSFDAALRASDPQIGYKDDLWLRARLKAQGLGDIKVVAMPANNLAFIASRASQVC